VVAVAESTAVSTGQSTTPLCVSACSAAGPAGAGDGAVDGRLLDGISGAVLEPDKLAHGVRWTGLRAVLARRRAFSSRTLTSRSRSATAGRQVRARGLPPGAGHAATGTQIALRPRSRPPARQHVLP
jgi:hypothetical protein